MKRLLLLAAAAGALSLSACETATPYQPLGAHNNHASGGFYDQRLEQNRFRVGFRGNSLTSRERVERYLLFRTAEVTLQSGFDWFTTVDRHTERKDSYYGDSLGYGGFGGGYGAFGGGYFSPYWGVYCGRFGGGACGACGYGGYGGFGGFGPGFGGFNDFDVQQVTRYDASVEVLMGHGAKPAGDRRAFDARQVDQNLRPTIQLPDAK